MKIVYLYDGTFPSGAADALQVANTCAALAKAGAEVTLVYCGAPDTTTGKSILQSFGIEGAELEAVAVEVSSFGGRGGQKARFARKAFALAADADVVYTRNLPSLVASVRRNTPVLYDTYRPWPKQYPVMKPLFRKLFKSAAVVGGVFHSSLALESFAKAGIARDKLRVMHNGFNASLYDKPMSKEDAKDACGIDRNKYVIGYTGRFGVKKGTDMLLDIIEADPSFQLLLAGGGGEESLMSRIEEHSQVSYLGWKKPHELPQCLAACDVVMIPPSSAPLSAGNTVMPIKVFTYLACGRTIVAPRSPDTAELLKHNENCYLVELDNIDETVNALHYLKQHAAEAQRLAEASKELSATLTWDARGRKLLDFIRERIEITKH